MDTVRWKTDEPHADNSETMCDYLENINMLDIAFVDGTYAEGTNARGQRFAIHASGDGDAFNHKIEYEALHTEDQFVEWVKFHVGDTGCMSCDSPLDGYDLEASVREI